MRVGPGGDCPLVGGDGACLVIGRQPLRSPRGEQRGVLVFSGSAVVVLVIGDEQPLVHELFFQGKSVRAGQVWLARRAGSTAGRGGKRRPGGVDGRLNHRLRRRRRHRESPALIRDAVAISDTRASPHHSFQPPKKSKTRDFSLITGTSDLGSSACSECPSHDTPALRLPAPTATYVPRADRRAAAPLIPRPRQPCSHALSGYLLIHS